MRRPILTLALLCSVTFFIGLGRPAISDSDEGFYAEASREMVEGGDWLTPHFNYEDRWQKPILYYWLTAATYVVAGESEWAARWWSALSGVGLVLLTWSAARKLTAAPEAAWLAGAITATSYGCFAMARLALPDLPLALLITWTIWSALQQRWVAMGLAAGLGVLMKGPIAIVVPALVLGAIWWRERRHAPVSLRGVAFAGLACVAVALPWYLAMTLEHGTPYLQSFFVSDNLERFATDRFNDPRPLWFYVPIVIGGMMPWSLFLLILPARSVVQLVRRQRTLTADEWRLVLWVAVPLLFFTISIGKQPRYILPVLPPLAILLARSIVTRILHSTHRPALAAATWSTAVLYVVIAILLYRARPLFITTYPQLTFAAVGVIAASAAALAWIVATRRWHHLPATAALCAALLLLSVQFGALAGVRPEPVERIAAIIKANRHANQPVGTYDAFVRNLVFYTRFKQVDLYDEGVALTFLKSQEPVLLIARAADLPRLESIAGVSLRTIARLPYLNAAGVRVRTVLSPIPDQDFETIVVVTNR